MATAKQKPSLIQGAEMEFTILTLNQVEAVGMEGGNKLLQDTYRAYIEEGDVYKVFSVSFPPSIESTVFSAGEKVEVVGVVAGNRFLVEIQKLPLFPDYDHNYDHDLAEAIYQHGEAIIPKGELEMPWKNPLTEEERLELDRIYDFEPTPSHGYLYVPIKCVRLLGIETRISRCSWQEDDFWKLEEDDDKTLFLRTLSEKLGKDAYSLVRHKEDW